MKGVLGVCAIGVVTLAGAAAVSARTALPAQKAVLKAIARAEALGHIDPEEANRDRATVNRTALLIRHLPPARSRPLSSQLAQAAAIAPKLTAPRALAVFGQLAANDNWYARRDPPRARTDITDADGLVYRSFGASGFELHPLANFSALNADIADKATSATVRLAAALIARGVPEAGGGTGWEYYFAYAGGRAPWLSGFAQAVAAQAFARAAALVPAHAAQLNAAARAAYRAIPGRLDRRIGAGLWIKLYSFSRLIVLNAQLQSAISVADYAAAESDRKAAALADALRNAAAKALPEFDTGYWTYYSLPANPSPLDYQEYVVQLLQRLAKSDTRFATAATRFAAYDTEGPAFKLADAGPGAVAFWISKPATVRISALGEVRRFGVAGGWHTVSWRLPPRAGIYPVAIHATDWAGNASAVDALPIVRVTPPPKPRKKKHPGPRMVAAVDLRAASTLPPLTVGAGLEEPAQGSLAEQDGFRAVRMTLVWPVGSSSPDPGAIAALNRLPTGTHLALDLYASPPPVDDAGRQALAAYAASVAQQVPTLHDLLLGPAPAGAPAAAGYEAALAGVYGSVKLVAPAVRVDGALDGGQSPRVTLAAIAAAYRASGGAFPLMDALAFHPAPGAGKNLWALTDLGKLTAALETSFGGTAQFAASLPLVIDDLGFVSAIPTPKLPLYSSPATGTAGLDEPSQAAAYAAVLKAVACRANVIEVLFHRLVDSSAAGEQSGLYYADGTPKTSLQPVVQAVAGAQGPTRACPSVGATGATGPASPIVPNGPTGTAGPTHTTGSNGSTGAPGPRSQVAPPHGTKPPTTGHEPVPLATPGDLVFPHKVSRTTPSTVRLGCSRACLYLVMLQRTKDGAPVLARRGAARGGRAVTVTLPHVTISAGSYRFAVWLVSQNDPGPVSVEHSGVVTTR